MGPEPVFTLTSLDHVVLRVSDIDRAIAFYCGVLGCVEERRVESIGLVQLRAGDAMIDLVPGAPDGRNMDHLAVRITPFDELSLRSYLEAHGVKVGEVARRYGAEGYGPSMYICDPDGNAVELKGPRDAAQ